LSVTTTRLLREQLYGVAPNDLATIGAVGLLLIAVSIIATCIPSWRAMRISPARALVG
jgi:ABC-type lipoprotein release transport system permease subunit